MEFQKVTSNFTYLLAIMLLGTMATQAKVVRHTFRVSYISGHPDGVWTTSILGINGKFPGPVVEAEVGDTIRITVVNNINDGQNLTMHWHGIHQRGTPFEDGPAGITQCPIKSSKSQIYTFQADLAGTYWYHSHVNSQYTEGLWGLLIIRAKREVHRNQYDEELIITLNDWYHTSGHQNEEWLLNPISEGAPPYPSSALMNGMGRYPCAYALAQGRVCSSLWQQRPVFRVQPGKTYRLRLINTAGWTAFNFTVEGHTLRIIEADGVDTLISEPVQAVHISAGQRYSFLLTIPRNNRPIGSRFEIRASIRTEFLFTRPKNINPYPQALYQEVTGVLVYSRQDRKAEVEQEHEQFDFTNASVAITTNSWSNMKFLNELSLTPFDRAPAPRDFTKNVELNILFVEDEQGIRRGSFNKRPVEISRNSPPLAMMIHSKSIPESLFPVYLRFGDIVQVVINNPELGTHPIHLHGHHFWVMGMGKQGDGNYNPAKHQLNFGGIRRDTVLVKEMSWLVIRFPADNVGVWTLHCHVDWHMLTGMSMMFVEAPEQAHSLTIPSEAKRVCADHNISI